MNIFIEIVIRDLRLALRSSGDIVAASMFFVIAVVLFPLGVGPGALLALLTLPLFIPVMKRPSSRAARPSSSGLLHGRPVSHGKACKLDAR